MNYYKHKHYSSKYTRTEYYEENRKRYEEKFHRDIEPRIDEIRQWLDEGEPICEIVKKLHTSNQTLFIYRYLYPEFEALFKLAIEKRKAHDIKCKKFTYTPPESKETLCWRCNNIVPNPKKNKGCEWSVEDKPVPGWDATETKLTVAMGNTVSSYCVHKCPKFKRFERGGST